VSIIDRHGDEYRREPFEDGRLSMIYGERRGAFDGLSPIDKEPV
jgi:hypothetical protein